ncbi:hypothetical protein BGX34_001519 [Mortierella sp. NVP85]|nr:hypothetical protein BGX34_001519 [Mortierella sp. NVP85]
MLSSRIVQIIAIVSSALAFVVTAVPVHTPMCSGGDLGLASASGQDLVPTAPDQPVGPVPPAIGGVTQTSIEPQSTGTGTGAGTGTNTNTGSVVLNPYTTIVPETDIFPVMNIQPVVRILPTGYHDLSGPGGSIGIVGYALPNLGGGYGLIPVYGSRGLGAYGCSQFGRVPSPLALAAARYSPHPRALQ